MGHFATESELLHHVNLREAFRYAKLIGNSDEEEDLKHYCDQLLYKFIEQQLVYFPNSHRIIGNWIATAGKCIFMLLF